MNKISYDVNCDESYTLLLNGEGRAELHLSEDEVIELVEDISSFIEIAHKDDEVNVCNDDDMLGVIVDVFNDDDLIDTCCFWFEDFIH